MPLNFPLNPTNGALHTHANNGVTYQYTNGSWTSLSSNFGNVIINEDSALKRKKIALYEAIGNYSTQINNINGFSSGFGTPLGKQSRYVPGATVYEKTDGVVYANTTAAAYNGVSYQFNGLQSVLFIPKRGLYLETLFGIDEIDGNAGHTFFVGFSNPGNFSNTNEWKTNMLSVAAQNIGIGYDNNDTTWKIAIPRLSGGALKLDTGIAKPSANKQLFKAVFSVDPGSKYFKIFLYDASANTLLYSTDIEMQDALDADLNTRRAYIGDYTALHFYQRLSSGTNSAKIGMLVCRCYAESALS